MQQEDNPRVSIIIVSYKSKDELPICLESIGKDETPCEIFIVDNASPDGTPEAIREYVADNPTIHLTLNCENKGLAYANNQPMHQCRGQYILILNPDTIVKNNTIKLLANYLDSHPTVGAVGPKCYLEDGSAHTSYHRDWTIFHILLWRIAPYALVRYLYDNFSKYKEANVLFVSGACLMMRRDLFLAIGGYDEKFFLTVEDTADLCLRAKQKGYQTVFFPQAEIVHLTGRSQRGITFFSAYQGYQGSIYYLRKHKGLIQATLLHLILLLSAVARGLISRFLVLLFPQRYGGVWQTYFGLAKAMIGRAPRFDT